MEDDYDSEFRYVGRPLAAVQGLDAHGRVIYLGTFNKVLFPSLRLAYVVPPAALVDAFGLYQERRNVLIETAKHELGTRLQIENADAGLHVAAPFTEQTNDREVSRRAASGGLDLPPLSRYLGEPALSGLIINYASVPSATIRQGIRRLAEMLACGARGRPCDRVDPACALTASQSAFPPPPA